MPSTSAVSRLVRRRLEPARVQRDEERIVERVDPDRHARRGPLPVPDGQPAPALGHVPGRPVAVGPAEGELTLAYDGGDPLGLGALGLAVRRVDPAPQVLPPAGLREARPLHAVAEGELARGGGGGGGGAGGPAPPPPPARGPRGAPPAPP